MPHILQVRNVSYAYSGFQAFRLADISLCFEAGSLTGFLGPNGSGKSTLLKLLAGLLRPVSGDILLEERDLHRLGSRECSRRISFVPQSTQFVFPFTAWDLVWMGRYPHQGRFGVENRKDRRICEKALTLCDALRLKDRFYEELSGGERQRVLLASALAQEPRILLLDEPATGLDLSHQVHLFNLLLRFSKQKGLCIICSLHDLNTAARFFPRVVLIKEGRVRADGPPEKILTPKNIRSMYGVTVRRFPVPGDGFLLAPSSRVNP